MIATLLAFAAVVLAVGILIVCLAVKRDDVLHRVRRKVGDGDWIGPFLSIRHRLLHPLAPVRDISISACPLTPVMGKQGPEAPAQREAGQKHCQKHGQDRKHRRLITSRRRARLAPESSISFHWRRNEKPSPTRLIPRSSLAGIDEMVTIFSRGSHWLNRDMVWDEQFR